MSRGKFQSKKRVFPALWALLILAALGASFGGVRAYLSTSTDAVTNSFTNDSYPTITVNSNNSITVSETDYAVYLRAAVVANWKNNATETILAANSGDYTLEKGANWFQHTDGFYYYTQAVTSEVTTSPVVSVTPASKDGYTLQVNVAVQAIQAVGSTDVDDISAVENAWGITPAQITESGS